MYFDVGGWEDSIDTIACRANLPGDRSRSDTDASWLLSLRMTLLVAGPLWSHSTLLCGSVYNHLGVTLNSALHACNLHTPSMLRNPITLQISLAPEVTSLFLPCLQQCKVLLFLCSWVISVSKCLTLNRLWQSVKQIGLLLFFTPHIKQNYSLKLL